MFLRLFGVMDVHRLNYYTRRGLRSSNPLRVVAEAVFYGVLIF